MNHMQIHEGNHSDSWMKIEEWTFSLSLAQFKVFSLHYRNLDGGIYKKSLWKIKLLDIVKLINNDDPSSESYK